tara:strand:+ start:480 stop:761 length:282 start_codon:yes stop_codon:yes gene_type:complete
MKNRYDFSEERSGSQFKWVDETHTQKTYGYVNDNLDTKNLEDADGTFEKLFIDIRDMLTMQGSWCCDNRDDVLNASQALARHISKNMNFYRNG